MNIVLIGFLFGVFGGLVRTGMLLLELYRLRRISFWGSVVTGFALLAAGGLGGIVFNISWVFSMLGGYAAVDLLGAISKAFKNKKVKFV